MSQEQLQVQLNELSTIMAIVENDRTRNYRRNHIVCEKTEGDSFFGGEGDFEDKGEQVNFDEVPKFDVGDGDFIEDRVVFGDDGHVIEVISQFASFRVLETVIDDGVVDNYLVEKGVETKVQFVATKHFCSLTNDRDEELVVDGLQDSHGGVFVDNVQDIVPQILVSSSSLE
ncbi:hypothetical protein Sjap_024136 [Stephania japonica]|uniref:Uncharacterized protein n=1 Tax=Stephania japonica TaxID=461633 RepID=A0AAP0HL75_9MAGN